MPYFKTEDGRVYQSREAWSANDSEYPRESDGEKAYRSQYRDDMLTYIKPGDTIYCDVRSVARSGMSRTISLFHVQNGKLVDITYPASVVMGDTCRHGAIRVHGCGMDMCFHTVYTLGRYLWPNGTPVPHGTRNGVPDSDGGYALKHRTI